MPQARVCVVDPIVAQVPMRRAEYPEVAKERYERAELRATIRARRPNALRCAAPDDDPSEPRDAPGELSEICFEPLAARFVRYRVRGGGCVLRSGVELDSPVVARVASGAIVEGDEGAAHATRDGTERVCCRQPESGFASLKALERMPDNGSYDRCPVAAALSPPRKDTLVFYLALDDGRESPPCPVRVIAPRAWRDKRRLRDVVRVFVERFVAQRNRGRSFDVALAVCADARGRDVPLGESLALALARAARDGGGDLLFVRRIGGVPAASVAEHVRSCVDDAAHGAKKTDIADAGEIEDDVVISVQYGGRASAVDYSSSSDDDRNETQRRLRRHETIGRNQKDPSAEAAATYARLEAEAKARASHDAATGRDAEAARAATAAAEAEAEATAEADAAADTRKREFEAAERLRGRAERAVVDAVRAEADATARAAEEVDARLRLARCYAKLGDLERAIAAFRAYQIDCPDRAAAVDDEAARLAERIARAERYAGSFTARAEAERAARGGDEDDDRARRAVPPRVREPRRRTHYSTLGVLHNASNAEIRRAYRELARQFHPDKNREPAAGERFKRVAAAYEVLGDPHKRREYDDGLVDINESTPSRDGHRGRGGSL